MTQSYMPWKLLLAGALTVQVACTAEGAEPMQILRNQAPEEGCIVPTSETGAFRARGLIDVNSTGAYRFTPLVKSFAVETENTSRIIFIEGANVDLEFTGPNIPTVSAELSFKSLFSGSIPAGGLSGVDMDLISAQLLADLADDVTPESSVQILASVQLFGTLDGDGIESNTFKYPVEVCDGCMLNDLGLCTELGAVGEVETGGVCNPLQDGILDCCTAADGGVVCPAVPEEPVL